MTECEEKTLCTSILQIEKKAISRLCAAKNSIEQVQGTGITDPKQVPSNAISSVVIENMNCLKILENIRDGARGPNVRCSP